MKKKRSEKQKMIFFSKKFTTNLKNPEKRGRRELFIP